MAAREQFSAILGTFQVRAGDKNWYLQGKNSLNTPLYKPYDAQSAEHGNCRHKKISSRSMCTPKIRPCTHALGSPGVSYCLKQMGALEIIRCARPAPLIPFLACERSRRVLPCSACRLDDAPCFNRTLNCMWRI